MTHHFWTQNGAFAPPPPQKKISFRKTINTIFMYLFTFSIVQSFKKIVRADPDL